MWEQTAIDALTGVGCRLILNEVFECNEPDALLARGDEFFGMLPQPDARAKLADTSPLSGAAPEEDAEQPSISADNPHAGEGLLP